jgi:hypothetical protein
MSSLLSLAPMALSFIPGIGPLTAAALTAGLTAGGGLLSGQGPLTALGHGAAAGGTQFGLNKLSSLINPSTIASNTTFGDPNQFAMMRTPSDLPINPANFSLNTGPSNLIGRLY